ncbi:hypothetical protein Tco_0741986 [Tanacetum coccineum]
MDLWPMQMPTCTFMRLDDRQLFHEHDRKYDGQVFHGLIFLVFGVLFYNAYTNLEARCLSGVRTPNLALNWEEKSISWLRKALFLEDKISKVRNWVDYRVVFWARGSHDSSWLATDGPPLGDFTVTNYTARKVFDPDSFGPTIYERMP